MLSPGQNTRGRTPRPRPASRQARLAHWRAWWHDRPGARPPAKALADHLAQGPRAVQLYAIGDRDPDDDTLHAIENLCIPFGYQPLASDTLFF